MENIIQFRLCDEDRARLDQIIEALGGLTIKTPVQMTLPVDEKKPQEDTKEDAKELTRPTEEESQVKEDEAVAEPTVTLEQIQQKVVSLVAQGDAMRAKTREIISAYGKKVSDLKDLPEKWTEVWAKLTALEQEG